MQAQQRRKELWNQARNGTVAAILGLPKILFLNANVFLVFPEPPQGRQMAPSFPGGVVPY